MKKPKKTGDKAAKKHAGTRTPESPTRAAKASARAPASPRTSGAAGRESAAPTPPPVRIGPGSKVDGSAIVGYPTGRKLPAYELVVGANAQIRAGTILYVGSVIGDGLETGHHVVIREQNRIGRDFRIWNGATIDYGCVIGDRVKIHCNCYVAQFTVLEDDVFLAPGVTIANDIHPGCSRSKECMRGPTLHRGVQVGVNATILPYVVIGEGSLIAAGAVVHRDVPPHSVVAGNPGKIIRRTRDLRCSTGLLETGPYEV